MEKSTKILIGVGVVGVVGLLIYNKAKAATPAAKSGGVAKKPSTNNPIGTLPDNPIIDPISGKLVTPNPTTPKKPTPSSKDTTDPNANPQFDMSKGIGSGGGGGIPSGGKGGGDKAVNNPDSNSGKFKKVDPNAKDENWIKALQKKQKAGNQTPNKKGKNQKETPKVDCYTNPYDPTCQKVKDCYYNPYDPSCSDGKYDYTYDYKNTYDYEVYDKNKYYYDYGNYDYVVGGYDNSGGGYDYSGGGYNYSGGGYDYSGGGYDYSGGYDNSSGGGWGSGGGGRGGNPSDFNDWYSAE
jgi:hypothetical protein